MHGLYRSFAGGVDLNLAEVMGEIPPKDVAPVFAGAWIKARAVRFIAILTFSQALARGRVN